MVVTFLKFVNQMLYRAENDEQRAGFIATLETQGIFKYIERQSELGNDEIDDQIIALEHNTQDLTSTTTYQLQVHKSRCKELEVHTKLLQRKIDQYKDQQNVYQMTVKELEFFKKKAEISKEIGTYFSPFTSLNQFSDKEKNKEPRMVGMNNHVLDIKSAIKDAQIEKIKTLEARNKELEQKCSELQASADENAKRFREQLEINFKSNSQVYYRRANGKINPM